ncbi:MAG TPA: ABC transporter substrate-binding protein [Candidatus Limnocylindrales bacterium]|nr:ABC transporter substrate-binding protein [Candidatus Limnocylindrales bacterium]
MKIILGFVLILFSTVAAWGAQATKLQFALNWKAEPEFGGFYTAKLSGIFQKRNLNVEIIEGGAGTPVVQMVANSKVRFGIAAADEVVISQARGTDVVALFAVYQINPQGIMVHPERGFKSIADVFKSPGTLAIQSGSPYALFLQKQFPGYKVTVVPYAGGIATFLTDRNFSQQCFVTSEPLIARKKGKPAQSFLIADAGFKPYGTVVIARRQYVAKNQKQTRDLIDAVREGWIEYLRAPEPANNAMVKLNPAMDALSMKEAAEVQKSFILGAGAPAQELGKMTVERWGTLVNQLYDLKLIKTKPAADKLFENF